MTFTEKHQEKLQRYREWEEEKQRRKQQRKEAKRWKSINSRSARLKERYMLARMELLRVQDYKCAICKRQSGTVRLVADSFDNKLVRGLLCYRCNQMLTRFKDDPSAIMAYQGRFSDKLRRSAVRYLNNWPSSKLPYFIYAHGFSERKIDENEITDLDTAA